MNTDGTIGQLSIEQAIIQRADVTAKRRGGNDKRTTCYALLKRSREDQCHRQTKSASRFFPFPSWFLEKFSLGKGCRCRNPPNGEARPASVLASFESYYVVRLQS